MKRRDRSLLVIPSLVLAATTFAACSGDDESASGTPQVEATGGASGDGGQDDAAGGTDAVGGAGGSTFVPDLRADSNRNGTIDFDDPTEDDNEETWDATRGAIFLANIDDDLMACPKQVNGKPLPDAQLAACNDAADEVINGDDDLQDLARLRTAPWEQAPNDAVGTLSLSTPGADYARLFILRGAGFEMLTPGESIPASELRAGIELAIEGKDVVRDDAIWDGFVDVTFTVDGGSSGQSGSDVIRLRLAPVLLSHHLQPAEAIYVTTIGGDPDSAAFRSDLSAAVSAAGVPEGLKGLYPSDYDQWTQDFFETGYMTMPAPGGGQHVITVFIRSANQESATLLRVGGRLVFEHFRGKNVAGLQQFLAVQSEEMDTLDSFGNTETIPPYEHAGEAYPFGRIIRGSTTSYYPDRSVTTLLTSQRMQPMLTVDTSWLWVSHIDETLTYVKADNARGWALVVNDPALARSMLEQASQQGHGNVPMFVGKSWYAENSWKEIPAEVTIDQVLANADVMAQSAQAAIEIDAQLDVLRNEVGITDSEIIRVPFLHDEVYGYSIAYQPGTVNGTVLSDTHFAAPDPHGPVIAGKDIFKEQMTETFSAHGITVHFIEDWNLYHRLDGEVHCGSNAKRAVPAIARWWETGR